MKFKEYKQLDLPTITEEILKQWEDEDTFSKSVSNREGKTPFIFYEGEECSSWPGSSVKIDTLVAR